MALYDTLTKKEFEEKVLQSDKTVLVDFWAAWCAPCRAMAPALKDVSESMDDKLDVVKVNIEESPANAALANEYGVQGIPNMQIFKKGVVVEELIGLRPGSVLKTEIETVLSK